MKTKFTLSVLLLFVIVNANSQVLLNEVYSDPGAGKHEFFELYNTNATAESMDGYTVVTFFDISGNTGFYVMDLPNISLAPKGYFVGSSAIPFNYQGVTNSSASDFSWNSTAFTSGLTGGYLKKWTKQSLNLGDGNPFYDQAALPVNFNDFFYRRTGMGASYSVFLYKNGVLVNAVIFGTGGYASVIPVIVNMPDLFVDMSGTSTDFTIKFSTYASALIENVNQDAGSDNGFIRKADGACASWDKSSSQLQHTPRQPNGTIGSTDGSIAVSSAIFFGTPIAGSKVNYDVVSAPAASFPITVNVYTDLGSTISQIDPLDPYIGSNTESVVTDGPFNTVFTPYNANVLLVVKTNVGCIDKIIFIPNSLVLPLKLISYSGNMNNGKVTLDWSIASNELVSKSDIEASYDGKNFESIAFVSADGKSGTGKYNYSGFTEFEKIYYRLRITDKSNVVTYSKVLVFSNEAETKKNLNIIGNTVTDKLTLSFQTQATHTADLSILDMNGKLVTKQKIQASKGNNLANISLPSSMNSGMYIAVLTGENENSSAKFIKQ